MYKEITVYTTDKLSRNQQWVQLFTCRGVACDEAWPPHRRGNVCEERVLYNGEAPMDDCTLYRYVGECDSGLRATAWYLSSEEACEGGARLKLCDGDIQLGTLNNETIEPLTQPLGVTFELDKRGRPFTRINSHPERDGKMSKGKIFFPDRSFIGADSGEALVTIAKEFETYGFLSGEMLKYGMPDMEDFLDWAWEAKANIQNVFLINHPGRGEYLAVEDRGCKQRVIVFPTSDGESGIYASLNYEDEVQADVERYLVWQKPLDELFLEAAWKMDVDLDVLDAQFVRSHLFESGLAAADWEKSVKFHGELVDSAVQAGILSQYVSPSLHIEVMTFNRQNIVLLGNYQYSDVREIVKAVSKINQDADTAGRAKVKKGLLLPF